jgi:transcriptional regulator with XRE-family HTH domain
MTLAAQSHKEGTVRRAKAARPLTVAEYLTHQINLSDKTQAEIAHEAGFNKPNIISMLKKGETKLPISKVAPMARALNVDPVNLFRMVMSEYEPETWAAIEDGIMHQPIISDNEYELVRVVRRAGAVNPKLTAHDRKRLTELAVTFGAENE